MPLWRADSCSLSVREAGLADLKVEPELAERVLRKSPLCPSLDQAIKVGVLPDPLWREANGLGIVKPSKKIQISFTKHKGQQQH